MTLKKIEEVSPYDGNQGDKKGEVTSMFDGIAPYYDILNRSLSLGIDVWWRKKAISKLEGKINHQMLDIATGTGDLALQAYKSLSPQHIVGLDISKKMLDVGSTKIAKRNLSSKISMMVGDSEKLPFEDQKFDTVMAAFGVRNFENLEKGLAEMYRVNKNGGQTMILEFSKPTFAPIKFLFNLYFKNILPVIGKLKSKDPKAYQYLYESVQAFPDYDNFANILKKLGYSNVSYQPLTFGICTIYLASK